MPATEQLLLRRELLLEARFTAAPHQAISPPKAPAPPRQPSSGDRHTSNLTDYGTDSTLLEPTSRSGTHDGFPGIPPRQEHHHHSQHDPSARETPAAAAPSTIAAAAAAASPAAPAPMSGRLARHASWGGSVAEPFDKQQQQQQQDSAAAAPAATGKPKASRKRQRDENSTSAAAQEIKRSASFGMAGAHAPTPAPRSGDAAESQPSGGTEKAKTATILSYFSVQPGAAQGRASQHLMPKAGHGKGASGSGGGGGSSGSAAAASRLSPLRRGELIDLASPSPTPASAAHCTTPAAPLLHPRQTSAEGSKLQQQQGLRLPQPSKGGSHVTPGSDGSGGGGGSSGMDENGRLQAQVVDLRLKLAAAEERVASSKSFNHGLQAEIERRKEAEALLHGQVASLQSQVALLRAQLQKSNEDALASEARAIDRAARARRALEAQVRALCVKESTEARAQLAANSVRVGRVVPGSTQHGGARAAGGAPMFHYAEVWEDGPLLREVKAKQASLLSKREELDKRRRQVTKDMRKAERCRDPAASGAAASAAAAAAGGSGDEHTPASPPMGAPRSRTAEQGDGCGAPGSGELPPWEELELLEADETVKLHQLRLKREELQLAEERKRLEGEKQAQIRLWRRVTLEDRSRFSRQPVLGDRYVVMQLLGRGGFSEVWKAFDLVEIREVAVKIHQLSSMWTDEKKAHYTRHAHREYKIHKTMEHPRVVKLHDVFEIDSSAMATVQELCAPGGPGQTQDLDQHLKAHGPLPEREAKAILTQLLSGLRYLHCPEGGRPAIIHYDLKPANVLFDGAGDVKITDFGLSKIVEAEQESGGVELTSQGAGTLWYLPPECFVMGGTAPRISGKVDVWSVGVIFFQMLYGQRPFGEGKDQQKVLHDQTMLRATQVDFPPKPAASTEAKAFIRLCLAHAQEDRPDVRTLCAHPYIRARK